MVGLITLQQGETAKSRGALRVTLVDARLPRLINQADCWLHGAVCTSAACPQ